MAESAGNAWSTFGQLNAKRDAFPEVQRVEVDVQLNTLKGHRWDDWV